MDQASQLKDFLTIYNNMSETCFTQCVYSFNSRKLEDEEVKCVDHCIGKLIKLNHRIMKIYSSVQGDIMQKRIKEAQELEAKQQALETNNNQLTNPHNLDTNSEVPVLTVAEGK